MFSRKKKQKTAPKPAKKQEKKKNELKQIIDQLNSTNLDIKRAAIRRIISGMTLGKDVSSLFPVILKNMETQNIELKKLIYLYIINYAKTYPDMAIMAINSFCKDAIDQKNPFMRGLAVRTMGCLRIRGIVEYLQVPLQESLKDEDAYVRKTGVLCVAKLFDSHPMLIKELELIEIVRVMLKDGNTMVVTNALACLKSIQEKGGPKLVLDFGTLSKFLTALEEASEWGQIIILDSISEFLPGESKQAERILERVSSRRLSKNAGVVLSAIRVMMKMIYFLDDSDSIKDYTRRVSESLTSFLSRENEIQYVALKNIQIIAEKQPAMLRKDLAFFFCGYSDPFYIKSEKLKIIVLLSDEDNIDQILHQLKEYIAEVDISFVRKCIQTIGKLTIRIEEAADKCVQALWDCLKRKSSLIMQESVIVIKDIFRKYPNRYEGLLPELCSEIKTIDEPEARASLIWILGEYIEDIENAEDIIRKFFLENFREEASQVQLQILTACVRLCLFFPNEGKALLEDVLEQVEDIEDVDLRKRGYFYRRLVVGNPQLAKKIVCSQKPIISDEGFSSTFAMSDNAYDYLVSTAAIYGKLPESFMRLKREFDDLEMNDEIEENFINEGEEDATINDNNINSTGVNMNYYENNEQQENLDGGDIIDFEEKEKEENLNIIIPLSEVLPKTTPGVQGGTGVQISASIQLRYEEMVAEFKITNHTQNPLTNFMTKFNENSYCLRPQHPAIKINPINPGETQTGEIPLDLQGNPNGEEPSCPMKIEVALNTNIDIFLFEIPVSFTVLLRYPSEYSPKKYNDLLERGNLIKTQNSVGFERVAEAMQDPGFLIEKFANNNFQFINSQVSGQKMLLNFVTSTVDGIDIPLRVLLQSGGNQLLLDYRVAHQSHVGLFFLAVKFIVNL